MSVTFSEKKFEASHENSSYILYIYIISARVCIVNIVLSQKNLLVNGWAFLRDVSAKIIIILKTELFNREPPRDIKLNSLQTGAMHRRRVFERILASQL